MDYTFFREAKQIEKPSRSKFKEPFEKLMNGEDKTLLINCASEKEYRTAYGFFNYQRNKGAQIVICRGNSNELYVVKA